MLSLKIVMSPALTLAFHAQYNKVTAKSPENVCAEYYWAVVQVAQKFCSFQKILRSHLDTILKDMLE